MHFLRMWMSLETFLATLSHQGHRKVSTTIPWWTSEIYHIFWVSREERVFILMIVLLDLLLRYRIETKKAVRLKDVIRKIKSPGQTVLDPCARVFATAKPACCYWSIVIFWMRDWNLLLQKWFLGNVEASKRQILDEGAGQSRWGRCAICSKYLCTCTYRYRPTRKLILWSCSRQQFHSQSFLFLIFFFLLNCLRDTSLYKRGKHYRYHNGFGSGYGGCIQWTWLISSLWTSEQLMWPWRSCWLDTCRLFLVVLRKDRLGSVR